MTIKPMRLRNNEVKEIEEIHRIIEKCDVIRVGMSVNNIPYIVAMNFAFKDNVFYFHGAKAGRKIDMIKANPHVCFEMDTNHALVGESERACDWTMTYTSVMGTGLMTIIDDWEQKREALNLLMAQYGGHEVYDYEDSMLNRIGIMKLQIKEMTGKKSG